MDINQKKIIRKQQLNLRDNLSDERVKDASEKIMDRIEQLEEYKKADTVIIYASYRKEVDTWCLIRNALAAGKHVALPKVLGPMEMAFYEIHTIEDLHPGAMGIMEPVTERDGKPLETVTEGLMIVPGVAFDKKKHRMGYGGGYYDYWLEKHRENVMVYAVAYDIQVLDEIPYEACDQPMDQIITPNRIYI